MCTIKQCPANIENERSYACAGFVWIKSRSPYWWIECYNIPHLMQYFHPLHCRTVVFSKGEHAKFTDISTTNV